MIGTIAYAAWYVRTTWSVDQHLYDIYSLFFTDKRMIAIHSSKLRLPGVRPFVMSTQEWNKMNRQEKTSTYMYRKRVWDGLKRAIGNNSIFSAEKEPLTQQMAAIADVTIPYSDVKQVKFKSAFVNLLVLERNSGEESQWEMVPPSQATVDFLRVTPLASKLKK